MRRLALRLLAAAAATSAVVAASAFAAGCSSADKSTDVAATGGDSGPAASGDGSVATSNGGDASSDGGTGTDGSSFVTAINSSTCAPADVFLNPATLLPTNADGETSVVAADLNGDGRTDLVQSDTTLDFTVFLSKGDGTFTKKDYPAGAVEGGNGTLFVLGDVDGDGVNDLLSSGSVGTGDAIAVRLGTSDGTFGDKALVSDQTQGPPEYGVLEDLNGDGKKDLVVLLQDKPYVMMNTGGKFAAAVQLPNEVDTQAKDPIKLADLNGDGKMDLSYLDSAGVCAAFGAGDGTFGTAACAPGSTNILQHEAIQIADVNGDGKADIVAANFSTGNAVDVFLNNGSGVFGTFTTLSVAGVNTSDVAIADFNNDRKLDLAVYQRDTFDIALLLGNGDGTFATNPELLGVGETVYTPMLVGNFLGDGLPGIVVPDALTELTLVNATCRTTIPSPAPITGDGGAAPTSSCATAKVDFGTEVSLTGPSSAQSVVAVDLDGDGKADLLQAGGANGSAFSYALSKGDGTFGAFAQQSGGGGDAVGAGDLNGDGLADVIVPTDPSHFAVSLNTGSGTFAAPVTYELASTGAGAEIGFITLADVNNDGHLDAFLDNHLILGLGDGTFAGHGILDSYFTGSSRVVPTDVNGDKQLDVAYISSIGTSGATGFCVALNIGNGNFGVPACTAGSVGGFPADLDVADVNGDGKADVVLANKDTTNGLDVFLGKGDGTFGSKHTFALPSSGAAGIRLHDLDNDGKVDVLVWDTSAGSFTLVLGAGDGTFSAAAKSYAGGAMGGNTATEQLAIGDFTGTGLYGFATPNVSRPGVDVYVTKCDP